MNRRSFLGTTALATAAGPSIFLLDACAFSSVMSKLATYLPIALKAVAGITTIVAPGSGTAVAAILGMVSGAFGALQGAVNDYNSAPAASK